MSANSKIEWTDATWNPIRGCSRVSEGCVNCYAEGIAARFSGTDDRGNVQPYDGLAKHVVKDGRKEPRWTGEVRFIESVLDAPLGWKRPRKIFVNSMSDLFHEKVPDAWSDRIFAVMALSPQHTFQVLTKRPERMRHYLNDPHASRRIYTIVCDMVTEDEAANVVLIAPGIDAALAPAGLRIFLDKWPLENVWLGVSVEDQATADARIPLLLQTPAAIRFVSYEPALGPVDFTRINYGNPENGTINVLGRGSCPSQQDEHGYHTFLVNDGLDWIICGGESGPHARPMHPDWARSVRDQCQAAGVPFFFKQFGEWAPDEGPLSKNSDPIMDGRARCAWWNGKAWEFAATGFDVPLNLATDDEWMYRIGKKRAGRLLDGVEHNSFPAISEAGRAA